MRSVTGNDAGTDAPLSQKLQKQLDGGGVSVGSGDVANFGGKDKPSGPIIGPVEAPTPPLERRDPAMEAAQGAQGAEQIQKEAEAGQTTQDALKAMTAGDDTSYGTVTLTQAEREAFVEALISGERYERSFSLYGGKLSGVFRARSQAETIAVIRYLNQQRRNGTISDMLEYATCLRNILLAAQVKIMNGDEYLILQDPLHSVVKGVDDVTEPGWLSQVEVWAKRQEGLNAALYNELRRFEQKYWAMVDGAEDQNFLNPEGSTSE